MRASSSMRLHFTVLTGILLLKPLTTAAAKISILANNTFAIRYDDVWKPSTFALDPAFEDRDHKDKDGGPGSQAVDCAVGAPSMQAAVNGSSFTFEFYGVSAELILASRPSHAPFDVYLDGRALGDSYSVASACSATWTHPTTLSLGKHTLRCVSRAPSKGSYLELLAIVYDDGQPVTSTTHETVASSTIRSERRTSPIKILRRSTSSVTAATTTEDLITGLSDDESDPASSPPDNSTDNSAKPSAAALSTTSIIAIGFGAGYLTLILIVGVFGLVVFRRHCRARPKVHRPVSLPSNRTPTKLRQARRVRLIVKSVDLTASQT